MAPLFLFCQVTNSAVLEEGDEKRTFFRKWSSEDSPKQGLLEALGCALEEAGLASYTSVAESWCMQIGAAFLSELLEEFDAFCSVLAPLDSGHGGLSPSQSRRLHAALVSRCSDSKSEKVEAVQSKLCLLPRAAASIEDSQRNGVKDFSTQISKPTEKQDLFSTLQGALDEAGLANYFSVAKSWCIENGAAFVSEILDEFQEFLAAIAAHNLAAFGPTEGSNLYKSLLTRSQNEKVNGATVEQTVGKSVSTDPAMSHAATLDTQNTNWMKKPSQSRFNQCEAGFVAATVNSCSKRW
jgi:hypothetical protein